MYCEHPLVTKLENRTRLVDIRLAKTRSSQTTTAFFEKAVETTGVVPEKVTTDKEVSYPGSIKEVLGRKVEHRTNKYLNNGIEQDHRGIKQRYYPMQSFKSESCAAKFIAAFEEQRFYFRFRRCPGDDLISLEERRNKFKGKYLRLKNEFCQKKLVWKQREFVLN
jgi:putative transposase